MTTYADVRDSIKDGTLIFLSGEKLGQRIIQFFTFGRFTHCAIAFWMTEKSGRDRLMCVESTSGGVRLVNLGAYANRSMDLVDVGLDWNKVSEFVLTSTGTVHYSLIDFVVIGYKGIMRKLGISVKVPNFKGEVCSEFMARVLNEDGFNVDLMLSPNSLYDAVKYSALNIIELEATK